MSRLPSFAASRASSRRSRKVSLNHAGTSIACGLAVCAIAESGMRSALATTASRLHRQLGEGAGVTAIGFSLTLASAVSWAIGNVLVKRLPKDMLHLMVWASFVHVATPISTPIEANGEQFFFPNYRK